MARPIISVCVPTYNGGKYLRESLDGVLEQSFSDFEIVLVDDKSSDDTAELLETYAARDSRIRLFHNQKNLGMVENWNRCLDVAEGEWIKFVFQDDKIDPHCLETFLERARPDVALMVCRRNFVYEDVSSEERAQYERYLAEYCLPAFFPEGGVLSSFRFCRLALELPALNFVGEPSAVMLHRSVRERFGGFNPYFVQLCDFEYWARIGCHGGLIFVPEVLASFRIHSDSSTNGNKLGREFRTELVDPLLLRYQFAYAPSYAPMRTVARQLAIDLKRSIATNARTAERIARRWAKDVLIPDDSAMTEWRSIVVAHPNLIASPYARVQQFNDALDRQLLWRFRDSGVRFKNSNTHCPVILCVDVEPDDALAEPDQAAAWKGFDLIWEFFCDVRGRLASVTGAPVHYTWMLRLDWQIGAGDRAPEWLVRDYASRVQKCIGESDEIGIYNRGGRWDQAARCWIPNEHDEKLEDNMIKWFTAFREVVGRQCESFRFGQGGMCNRAIALLEELGARFDLSLQRGMPLVRQASPDHSPARSHADPALLPAMPYRPALEDFARPDPSRTQGLWMIPLSAGIENDDRFKRVEKPSYRALDLKSPPYEFEWLANTILTSFDRPYLALKISSSVGIKPRHLRNLKMNFSSLLMHPLADRFVISTPAETLSMLGY